MSRRVPLHTWIQRIKAVVMGLFVLITTACASAPAATPLIDPTLTPAPTEKASIDITLYRGNTQRMGVFDFPAVRQVPHTKWQTKVSSTWLMPPILADGTLYTGSGDGVIYALDAQTGQEVWSTDGFGQLENSGAVAGDLLIVGGYDKRVRALNRHTGEVLWAFDTLSFVQASPLIVNEQTYIATDHTLYALDLASGELQWEAATGEEDAYMGPPAYDDGVIYTTGGKHLLALEATNGEELWRIQRDQPFTALAVANQMIYVGNFDGSFYAYDRQTGEERWNFQGGGIFWGGPAIEGDIVYAGNDDMVYALHAQTGEERWRFQMAGQGVSDIMISDGVLYVSDSSHEFPRGPRHLYALDAQSGEEIWTFEVVSTFLPAPALGEDSIFITTTGEVYALE
jgi:eukaryotic-like serine/threonine-protein kinase